MRAYQQAAKVWARAALAVALVALAAVPVHAAGRAYLVADLTTGSEPAASSVIEKAWRRRSPRAIAGR